MSKHTYLMGQQHYLIKSAVGEVPPPPTPPAGGQPAVQGPSPVPMPAPPLPPLSPGGVPMLPDPPQLEEDLMGASRSLAAPPVRANYQQLMSPAMMQDMLQNHTPTMNP